MYQQHWWPTIVFLDCSAPVWAAVPLVVRWCFVLLLVGCEFEEAAAEFAAGFEPSLADQRSYVRLPWWSIIMLDMTTKNTNNNNNKTRTTWIGGTSSSREWSWERCWWVPSCPSALPMVCNSPWRTEAQHVRNTLYNVHQHWKYCKCMNKWKSNLN